MTIKQFVDKYIEPQYHTEILKTIKLYHKYIDTRKGRSAMPLELAKLLADTPKAITRTNKLYFIRVMRRDPTITPLQSRWMYYELKRRLAAKEESKVNKSPSSEKKSLLHNNTTYYNPEIQYHLDIAHKLIEEERLKMEIYNEMKALIG